jgi:hypothetical protein
VAAALRQQAVAGLERGRDMEVGRSPNRATYLVTDQGRGADRPREGIGQPSGHQADQSRRPAVVPDEEWRDAR